MYVCIYLFIHSINATARSPPKWYTPHSAPANPQANHPTLLTEALRIASIAWVFKRGMDD